MPAPGYGSGGDRRTGVVAEFDETVGLGTLRTDTGDDVAFHCIVIADGTRTIEVGTRVTFTTLPKLGRYEAADIRPA